MKCACEILIKRKRIIVVLCVVEGPKKHRKSQLFSQLLKKIIMMTVYIAEMYNGASKLMKIISLNVRCKISRILF